ncbi:hypothetical protein [Streptomyces sp. AC550_RSS872]|uniref:hypothetical protein n=1 Tax=Streptomyces sp. AC550_RSS872 TaxID=2823689 RepID=UPI0020B8E16F|nr:hypothetical protein [Streptomyces sp. AC550_RSS872]
MDKATLPTMLVAFARCGRDGSFAVLGANRRCTLVMVAGSIAGAALGGLLLGVLPDMVLIPAPAVILLCNVGRDMDQQALLLMRSQMPPDEPEARDG